MLTDVEIRAFQDDGFVAVRGAFPRAVADACAAEIWAALPESPDDPTTWTVPVRRLDGFGTPPFAAAAQAPVLHEAFDQLVGPGRWVPRTGLGTIPVRFPTPEEPGDDGWHVEGSRPRRTDRSSPHTARPATSSSVIRSSCTPPSHTAGPGPG